MPRGLLAVLDRDRPAQLAYGRQLAIETETELSRNHQQIAGAHESDVIGHGRGRCAERNPKICKLFFNCPRHLSASSSR